VNDTKILTLNHLALRVLEDVLRFPLVKERRDDRQWDVLVLTQLADGLVDAADSENTNVSDFIIGHRTLLAARMGQ
jgi:hypothetical protein